MLAWMQLETSSDSAQSASGKPRANARPTIFLIAGPNGAGKTTFYETVLKSRIAVPFINADLIQRDELRDSSMEASYRAAEIAGVRRAACIEAGKSFVTETVFSHPSKLDLLTGARARGFRLFVFHLGLATADLAVARVKERGREGGHPVPEHKVRERFVRNAPLIRQAALIADRAAVYDASGLNEPPELLLRFEQGRVEYRQDVLPGWCQELYGYVVYGGVE